MSRVYHFEENVGKSLNFNPESDVLIITAGSPDEIVVSAFGSDLTLATPSGMVTLKSVGLHQLNPHNVAFTPAAAIAARIAEKPAAKTEPVLEPEPAAKVDADDLFAFADARKPANSQGPQTADLFTGKVEAAKMPYIEHSPLPIVEISSIEAANCGYAAVKKANYQALVHKSGTDYVIPPQMSEDSGLDLILPVSHALAIEFSSSASF